MGFFSAYERRVFRRCILIGVCVTTIVLSIERAGGLEWLENLLDDQRATLFQKHSLILDSKVVHIDLDDASISEIGRPPWRRSVIADAIDELTRAGVKCIATDIIFDEQSEDPRDDRRLADAIAHSGRVVMSLSIDFEADKDKTALANVILDSLTENPEQSVEELSAAVANKLGVAIEKIRPQVSGEYLRLLDRALLRRLEREYPKDLPPLVEVSQRITPRAPRGLRTNARAELPKAYEQLRALRSAARFDVNGVNVPLLSGSVGHLAGAELLSPAVAVGFVDFLPAKDGTVRFLPLLAGLRGKTFAQLSLVTACVAADIPLSSIRIQGQRLTAGVPGGAGFDIPVRSKYDPRFGQVDSIADVFFQGDRNQWQTMYDAPRFASAAKHISFRDLYALHTMDREIAKNDQAIENALAFLLTRTGGNVEQKVAQLQHDWPQMPTQPRHELIDKTLANRRIAFFLQSIDQSHPQAMSDDAKKLVTQVEILKTLPAINDELTRSNEQARQSLRHDLEGKIAMLGWTATAKTDTFKTSLHAQCPGVVIQSAMINSILANRVKHPSATSVGVLLTLFAGLVSTSAGARIRPTMSLLLLSALCVAYLFFNGWYLYDRRALAAPMAGVVVAMLSVWVFITLFRFVFESKEKARITRRFQSQVDPRVVNYFIEHPELSGLAGERRELTVVFTDIQGFSALSEKLKERVIPIINEYMGRMMPIIRANEGTWDKFIGDGIMFFFNAPLPTARHASKAVATVLQMHKETAKLSDELAARELPRVSMRAGVCTGPMIVGDAGSLNEKFFASSYTVLGDLVNLASRLEAANKFFGTRTLVLRDTMLAANEFLYRPIAKLRVYGKQEAAEVFEPIALRSEATPEQVMLAEATSRVATLYRGGSFNDCLTEVARLEQSIGASLLWKFYREQLGAQQTADSSNGFDGAFNLLIK